MCPLLLDEDLRNHTRFADLHLRITESYEICPLTTKCYDAVITLETKTEVVPDQTV